MSNGRHCALLRATGSPDFAGLAAHGLNGPARTWQALHVGCLYAAALIGGGVR